MTQAQEFAALFNNDGQTWTTADGRSWSEVTDGWGGLKTRERAPGTEGPIRLEFSDGSVLVEDGDAWDIGCNTSDDCFCWKGAGCSCGEDAPADPTNIMAVK